ncbi:MAG: FG-GAP-like repeat-containing protein, partial [Gemmataceae bacterium]
MFARLFDRLTGQPSNQASKRRQIALSLARLEDRCVPAVLMTNGGQDSIPTWGETPTAQPVYTASIFTATNVVTKDIHNQPIDFNQDGFPDLAETGVIDELVNYGSDESVFVSSSRDGFGKVAFGSANGLIYSTTGSFEHQLWHQFNGNSYAVADLNNDGYQDILALKNASNTGAGAISRRWLWNQATQTFIQSDGDLIDAWAVRAGQLTLGDVNGDQIPDLIGQVYDPTATWNPHIKDYVYPLKGFQVFLGKLDPVAGHWTGNFESTAYATVNLATPSVQWGAEVRTNVTPIELDSNFANTPVILTALADLNGDGKLDLVIPEENGITVFTNPGDGKFTQSSATNFLSAGSARGLNLVTGDFNNDGKTDLATSPNLVSSALMESVSPSFRVWTASTAPVSVFLNNTPTGGAIDLSLVPVDGFASQGFTYNGTISVADFTGDGNLDLAIAEGQNQSTSYGIVEGDGKGGFGSLNRFIGYSNNADGYDNNFQRGLVYLNTGDFNNDGQIDVVSTALNVGQTGKPSFKDNPAVGITALSLNKTFPTPVVQPAALPTATVGIPYSYQLQVAGGDPGKPLQFALNAQSVPLPAGLSLSSGGLISGTPTQPGPFQLFVDISQPNGPKGTSPAELVVNLSPSAILTINPATLPGATAGTAYSQQLSTTGGTGTIAYAINSGALPPGLTLSPTGLISGTPTTTGVASFTVSATDSAGNVG